MRTSRVSKESADLWDALSSAPSVPRRSRRLYASALKSFEPRDLLTEEDEGGALLSPEATADVGDILLHPAKRRKINPATTIQKTSADTPTATKGSKDAQKCSAVGRVAYDVPKRAEPPANWEYIYNIVKKMRENNPTAPVDTMGCAELYWRGSSPRDQRFQILIALMLSSQTKDTVTAAAMQRLHTELESSYRSAETKVKVEADGDDASPLTGFIDSRLNLENILAASPEHLNELIRTVGFHNNKTRYIKAVAPILRDQYNSDIPDTAKGLMALPGVGPKMAYLCMSAAWGKNEGIGVDVHVHRITNLWGWHKTKTPEQTRVALESWLPKDKWYEINKLLVGLGQTVCPSVGRKCRGCVLFETGLCDGQIKNLKADKSTPKAAERRDNRKDRPSE